MASITPNCGQSHLYFQGKYHEWKEIQGRFSFDGKYLISDNHVKPLGFFQKSSEQVFLKVRTCTFGAEPTWKLLPNLIKSIENDGSSRLA